MSRPHRSNFGDDPLWRDVRPDGRADMPRIAVFTAYSENNSEIFVFSLLWAVPAENLRSHFNALPATSLRIANSEKNPPNSEKMYPNNEQTSPRPEPDLPDRGNPTKRALGANRWWQQVHCMGSSLRALKFRLQEEASFVKSKMEGPTSA
jgi:hypothetical protein